MRVWAEIDLAKIRENHQYIQKIVGSQTKILSVVKSDSYGHGSLQISRELASIGTHWLGVGDSSEALELRENGIKTPILILGAIVSDELEQIVENDVSICIHSPDRLKSLQKMAESRQKKVGVHLNIDTGMRRLGVSLETGKTLLKQMNSYPLIHLEGICTHFSNGTALDQSYTHYQLNLFQKFLSEVQPLLPSHPIEIHSAASATLFDLPESRFSMVRPGISLYGMDPGNLCNHSLQPALTLKTQVIYLKDLPAGSSIGYNLTYKTYKNTRIATLPIGYNDGYQTPLSNRASVLIHGQFAPVVGRVTMDYTMVDVSHIPEVEIGDEVVLIGKQGKEEVKAEELANWSGLVPYEVTCGLGKRVQRIYYNATTPEKNQIRSYQSVFLS